MNTFLNLLGRKNRQKSAQGFTIIEILITLFIMAVLTTIVLFSFSEIRGRQNVDASAEAVTAILKEARSRTLSSLEANTYGVYLETNRATLFRGASYVVGDPTNQIQTLPDAVRITALSLNGGGNTVLFERLTGKTTNFGTLRIELVDATTTARTIIVDATGLIENN